MPLLSSPRMTPFFRSTPVPGTWLPDGAKTPFMPVRAFGAPQTTWIVSEPVSTLQTRSRSAFGCCTASMTWAMVKGHSFSAGLISSSTSSPSIGRVSQICSSVASVSRCSFSQDSENFIG